MNLSAFFSSVRASSSFSGRLSASQVRGIQGMIDGFTAIGDGRQKTLAYGLATARREVGAGMVPVREGFKATDAEARAFVKAKGYRYATPIDGQVYYGRGYVQLTWQTNYAATGERFGVNLAGNPDLALDPTIAAKILFWGIQTGAFNAQGHGIAHYLPDTGRDDLQNARRTVNLTDHWQEVAGHYAVFMAALDAAGFDIPAAPAPEPAPAPEAPETDPEPLPAPASPEPDVTAALAALAAWRARAPSADDFAAAARVAAWLQEIPA